MNPAQAIQDASTKFKTAGAHFADNLKALRTGRANSAMLDGVMVEAYGTPMPLNQVATVTAPEAQLLQITPFDPTNLQAIATAIRNNQQLGLNPMDDGRVVRVPVPALTEERRRDLAKQVGERLEQCNVQLRNIRHDALDVINKAQKAKEVGEDEAKRLEKQVDDAMSAVRSDAEAAAKTKEQEIMTL